MPIRLGPVGERVLQGIVLAMAGPVASAGVTFGCAIRNVLSQPGEFARNFQAARPDTSGPGVVGGEPDGVLIGMDLASISFTILPALVMLIWLWAAYHFIRAEPRSPVTWIMAVLIATAFALSAVANWQMAYPVCNPF
jgi:hypothetical protein